MLRYNYKPFNNCYGAATQKNSAYKITHRQIFFALWKATNIESGERWLYLRCTVINDSIAKLVNQRNCCRKNYRLWQNSIATETSTETFTPAQEAQPWSNPSSGRQRSNPEASERQPSGRTATCLAWGEGEAPHATHWALIECQRLMARHGQKIVPLGIWFKDNVYLLLIIIWNDSEVTKRWFTDLKNVKLPKLNYKKKVWVFLEGEDREKSKSKWHFN